MTRVPRVAFFTDSYLETNGVARTSRALIAYARRYDLPLLCVHGGAVSRTIDQGPVTRLELARGPIGFGLEHDLRFDLLFWRHGRRAAAALRRFAPDLVHITGPGDVGQIGAYLAHKARLPIVGSWHTNLHEFAGRRALERLSWIGAGAPPVASWIERQVLALTLQFYRIPRVILAPNTDLVSLLTARTAKKVHLMGRGVNTDLFNPACRTRRDAGVHVGFVGRLSAEKGVRVLPAIEERLREGGAGDFRLIVVGEGSERPWLERHLRQAEFRGLLHGKDLARAYADLDLFVFPSETDTFGLVLLEAMASGVPVVAVRRGGPGFVVRPGVSGVLVERQEDLPQATLALVRDRALREQLRRGARAQAEASSWDALGRRLYDIYRETAWPGRGEPPEAVQGAIAAAPGAGGKRRVE